MKKLFLATASLAALAATTPASAADMPVKAVTAAPRCAQFGGVYIGGHVASTTHNWTWNDRDAWARNEVDLALPGDVSRSETGFGGGAQAGWNWQSGCTVFGIEVDWTWTGLRSDTFNTDGQDGLAFDSLAVNTKLNWYGTARTRTGVVVDSLLIYVTGGFIWADIDRNWAVTNFVGLDRVTETFTDNHSRWGWTVGVGTEWQFWNNWSLKGEALYAQLVDRDTVGNSGFAALNGNPSSKKFDTQDSLWIGRFGVNYRFGGNPF
jgi:outer membrane immunogenic protein